MSQWNDTLENAWNVSATIADADGIYINGSLDIVNAGDDDTAKRDFVFDRTDVRIIFISLYSLVFCGCFVGNLLVILVVTLSRRLRTITNFFLANLAVADFCVGIFCVMQNLSIYLIDSWVFGEFMCKMYQFVHALSYTASIFILMIICMERYFAIIFPITCKQILTPIRLRLVIVGVWLTSALYSTPRFIFSRTITNIHSNGISEEICIMNRKLFNSKLLDFINFLALYALPLLVMTVLYSRIAVVLWRSSKGLEKQIAMRYGPSHTSSSANYCNYVMQGGISKYVGSTGREVPNTSDSGKVGRRTWRTQSFHGRHHHNHNVQLYQLSSNNVLRARRGVIRMLINVVLAFALCNLPLHARKIWQYWSENYNGASNFNALLTPLTFLVSYFNSAINPFLYAFLSRNFRKGMRELLLCSFKKTTKTEPVKQRLPINNHSLPTDTTYVGNIL